jgi:hypothetical protein
MKNHEDSLSRLEKKCVSVFENMRIKIALRHICNFENFLIESEKSLSEKFENMYLYNTDNNKPDLFEYVKNKGKYGRRIVLYWEVINFVYKMLYPFMFIMKNNH